MGDLEGDKDDEVQEECVGVVETPSDLRGRLAAATFNGVNFHGAHIFNNRGIKN